MDVCLAPAAFFGFSEETKSFALAMLSPYYSRALSDEAVRLYSPRTGVTSGVYLNLHSWIGKGNVLDIAIVDDSFYFTGGIESCDCCR